MWIHILMCDMNDMGFGDFTSVKLQQNPIGFYL